MTRKQKRFALVATVAIIAAAAVGLTLKALSSTITYFYTPSDLAGLAAPPSNAIRLGGLVEVDSLEFDGAAEKGEVHVAFTITDGDAATRVIYNGILPDLFREGQGVIVQGRLGSDGVLVAENVLAKHDENYMPKEVADALKEKGRWKEGEAQ